MRLLGATELNGPSPWVAAFLCVRFVDSAGQRVDAVAPAREEINLPEVRVERRGQMPPCSRCGEPVLMSARMPIGDGVSLELCRGCDREDPVAARVLELLRDPSETRSQEELAATTEAWMQAAMRARGWVQIPHQRASVN